jgi:hypothetical protein
VAKAAESKEHLKVTPEEVSVKVKAAEVEVVGLDGCEVIDGAAGPEAASASSTK